LSFCSFSFGHCVFWSSSTYGFWLPLCCLQTLLGIEGIKKQRSTKHTPKTKDRVTRNALKTANQVVVEIVKLSKWWLQLTKRNPSFSRLHGQKRKNLITDSSVLLGKTPPKYLAKLLAWTFCVWRTPIF
jgi:hypothetical protein